MAKTRICPECGQEFETNGGRGKPRIFCTEAHKQAHANRRGARGKTLVTLAQAWRKTRGSGDFGKFLFSEVTTLLDAWNAEDLEAGRLDPVEYAKLVVGFQSVPPGYYDRTFNATRWIDRVENR